MKRKMIVLVLAISLLSALSVGCAPEAASVANQTTSSDEESGATADESGALKSCLIGYSMYTLGSPYFVAQANAVEEEAKARGCEIISINADDDMNKQLADVEDLLAKNIDLLLLNPKDPKGLIPATKAATEAGVPVIIIDSNIDPSADYVTTVQSNNYGGAFLIGQYIAKEMGDTPIKLAYIGGVQSNPADLDRRDGVFTGIIEGQLSAMNKTQFEIVTQGWGQFYTEGGMKAAEDVITAHKEINVIYAMNDPMLLGVLKALEQAGIRDQIQVIAGFDGMKEVLKMVKEGDVSATGLNSPTEIGETAVDIGIRYLQGERGFDRLIRTPPMAITEENVDEYYDPNSDF